MTDLKPVLTSALADRIAGEASQHTYDCARDARDRLARDREALAAAESDPTADVELLRDRVAAGEKLADAMDRTAERVRAAHRSRVARLLAALPDR